MQTKVRKRLKYLPVSPELHALVKEIAGHTDLPPITEELVVIGLKMKKKLPHGFHSQFTPESDEKQG